MGEGHWGESVGILTSVWEGRIQRVPLNLPILNLSQTPLELDRIRRKLEQTYDLRPGLGPVQRISNGRELSL